MDGLDDLKASGPVRMMAARADFINPLDAVVAYQRGEIDRLQALLRAERLHNGRLLVACAHLKEAAGAARTALVHAHHYARADSAEAAAYESAKDVSAAQVGKADDLLLPEAE